MRKWQIAPLAAAALVLAGCSNAVSSSEVEDQIFSQLQDMGGVDPEEVTCPEDLPAEEGESITCELTESGETLDVYVEALSVDGAEVEFSIEVLEP